MDSFIELQSTQGVSFQKSIKNTHCKLNFPLFQCFCQEFLLCTKNAEIHLEVHRLDKALGKSDYS